MELNIYKQHTETTDGRKTINEALDMLFSRAGMFVAVMLVLTLCAGAEDTKAPQIELPEGTSTDWWTAVQEDIRTSEYDVIWQEKTQLSDLNAAYHAPNRAHNLRTYFAPESIRITPRESTDWVFGLSLVGYGFADDALPVSEAEMSVSENRVEYRRGCLTEWYVNREDGLEQGFTIDSPPESGSQGSEKESWIAINMDILGDLNANMNSASDMIEFTTTGGVEVLRYSKLYAFDAAGRELDARFTLSESTIGILVDTCGAVYPITIDPLAQSPAWTAEGNQIDARFGHSVAGAGDVNGDGYSDVIVGAYRYDNGEADEGRAYVYHGSETGLSASSAWTAESNQSTAYFGRSVASAGDVNGDGYSDVIVGAHYYDNGETNEGRAYVYHGSATGLSASSAWTAESNQSTAYFGRSVASAGDVDNDSYSDVIVGAYMYNNGQSGEGRAYVYHGSASCTCGDICVNETGWWRDGGAFNASGTPIQAAVDNATAGETICVRDGTYSENVDVDVAHLTIRSESGSANCIVDAASSSDHVFEVTVDYVNISGFTATGATGGGNAGIYLNNGVSNCNISDNSASGNYGGIYLYSSSNNTLLNNNASLNDWCGIYLHTSSNDNTLTNNTANSNTRHGILLKNSSYCNVENNTANNNRGFEGEGDGPLPSTGILILGSHNVIRQNDASNNFIGIVVNSGGPTGDIVSANNTIEGNTASNNSDGGIRLKSSDNCTISINIVSYSGTQGIDIVDSWYCEVCDSIVSFSTDRGIVFEGGGNNTAHDNTVHNNSAFGAIEAISSDNNTFYNNTAYSNMWGIATNNASNNLIYNNIVYSNDHGIYLDWPSTGNKVYKNNISENDQGIVTNHNSHDNIITNNLLDSNDMGVLIVTDDNTVANNTVSNNDDGIHLYSSSNNTIYNNYFNNTNNAYDDGNNIWNITKTAGTNIVGGSWLGGNYWSDYTGVDNDGDRLGDTMLPYNSSGNIAYGGDWHPLTTVAPPPAPPAIISWCNDKTNDDSLHITLNESESVRFNATANQTITTWNWFNNGVAQPDNNDYYTTSWSVNGTYTASVNATNANGTSDTKMWTITVKSCDYDPADTNQDCVVSMMELMAHISKWKRGDVEMMELMTSIGRWKLGTGGYCQC